MDTPRLDRRAAVAAIVGALDEDVLVVTGLGSPTYDVHAAGDRPSFYYLWGAMGSAALVGLGLAMAQPDRKVLVLTGDGEQLMGLGGLATIGVQKPANFCLAVIDNRHYGETGMQESHTGSGVDLCRVADGCGFARTRTISTMADVDAFASDPFSPTGPSFASVEVAPGSPKRSIPPLDGVHIKNRLRGHVGLPVL